MPEKFKNIDPKDVTFEEYKELIQAVIDFPLNIFSDTSLNDFEDLAVYITEVEQAHPEYEEQLAAGRPS
jgi:hypothetical protein